MTRRTRRGLKRCPQTKLVILKDELEAKVVLAYRQNRDKGEKRYFRCGDHYHLTSQEIMPDHLKETSHGSE